MKQFVLITLLVITSSCLAGETDKASLFFQEYIELSDNFDIAVVDLYSDNAKIHAYRAYPHGLERAMELNGTQWKQLLARAMPMAKMRNDKSSFSSISISKQENGYKIKADRYSEQKCYTDKGYYMVVEPDVSGKLYIAEEYMETQPQSNC